MPLFSCAGKPPTNLGVKDEKLTACPAKSNCVSSDDAEVSHRVPAYQLAMPAAPAWKLVRTSVTSLPRTQIISETDDYLHAECTSALFGFVDDLELHLRAAQNLVAVRSASRLGHSDFGVNRRRVENLRLLLRQQGVIR